MSTEWHDGVRAALVLGVGVLLIGLLIARAQTIDNLRKDHCELIGGDRALRGEEFHIASADGTLYHFTSECKLSPARSAITPVEGWTVGTPWPAMLNDLPTAGRYEEVPAGTPTPAPLAFSVTRHVEVVDVDGDPNKVAAFDGAGANVKVQPRDRMAFFDPERGGMLASASGFVWSLFILGFAIALLCMFFMELGGAPWDRAMAKPKRDRDA